MNKKYFSKCFSNLKTGVFKSVAIATILLFSVAVAAVETASDNDEGDTDHDPNQTPVYVKQVQVEAGQLTLIFDRDVCNFGVAHTAETGINGHIVMTPSEWSAEDVNRIFTLATSAKLANRPVRVWSNDGGEYGDAFCMLVGLRMR